MKKVLVAVVAGISLVGICAQANLISNGSIEGGTGLSDVPDWNSWGSSGTLEGGYYQDGAQSVRFWWDDTGFWQNFDASEGEEINLEAYCYTPSGGDIYTWDGGNLTYATALIEWYDVGETKIGEQEGTHFTPDSAADTWVQITANAVAPENTAHGRVVFGIRGAGPGSGTVAFDNISVTSVIPEPTTFALFGLAIGGLFLRRKARK
ncbi:MAG: PEP-CTERM sorting domain-containing protein [Spartobacteria bacterium]|nr:PEP-CTERM sorting domain-containing protein [Spartobacteria bacterium]